MLLRASVKNAVGYVVVVGHVVVTTPLDIKMTKRFNKSHPLPLTVQSRGHNLYMYLLRDYPFGVDGRLSSKLDNKQNENNPHTNS